MSKGRLQVTDLDFDTIKTNLKDFLRQQSEFQDYDFEGAGLNVLLDILAYNTHYNSYYLNMVANESFLDTAIIRDSVVSHAKSLSYIPYSASASRALIDLTINTIGVDDELTLPRGFKFKSNLVDGVLYTFSIIDDVTVTKSNQQFYFENLPIYQGEILNYTFNYTEITNPKSIFTLPNDNIDTTTLKVEVLESSTNTSSQLFTQSTDIITLDSNSPVYFIQEGRDGKYQIYFGDDVIGKKLKDGNIVSVSYLVTSGSSANKVNQFFVDSFIDASISSIIIDIAQQASGGADRESVDAIKNAAPKNYSTQNRLVTIADYEAFIKKNYSVIDSLTVWGGEDNDPPVYGKVFVSLSPKQGYFISDNEKQRIVNDIIKNYSIVSISTEIVDPIFDFVLFDVNVDANLDKTSLEKKQLEALIKNTINSYVNRNLNQFNASLITSKLQEEIDSTHTAINGNIITVKLQKRFTPIVGVNSTYDFNFNTSLTRETTRKTLFSSSFIVTDSAGTNRTVVVEENPLSFTGISRIDIVDPGFNFTSIPTVTITGDGEGAQATATMFGGKIQSIILTNSGRDYTTATVTISGGGGIGARAVAIVDYKVGTLRTVYFDNKSQRKIVNENIGNINYDTGRVQLNNLRIVGTPSNTDEVRITVVVEQGTIRSSKNNILTFDNTDPSSISVVI